MFANSKAVSIIVNPNRKKLEQLERLRSEDTPRRLMITHTLSHVGSQVKTGRMTLMI